MKNIEIIGNASSFTQALEHLSKLAPLDRPALILGERGTGKELAAERLHYLSNRWDKPFLKINCAALTKDLLESELFGHEAGAFTGASKRKYGRFERANGGTLFMDELGTLSLAAQEKLLRVIEYGEMERLGGEQTIEVDVRIIAATNQDLPKAVKTHEFRADLLDRLSFDVIHLPPLRYRQEDILELAYYFAQRMCGELNQDWFAGFSDGAIQKMENYAWPGNIRELKNVVERSIYRWQDETQPVDDIILDPFQSPFNAINEAEPITESMAEKNIDSEKEANTPELDLAASSGSNNNNLITAYLKGENLTDYLLRVERKLIETALQDTHQHQGKAADALGLSYHQLRGLLKKHKLTGKKMDKP